MRISDHSSGRDRTAPPRSEDGLLLGEAHHRTANEVAAAIAAMRLARGGKGGRPAHRLIDQAIDRLEAFGETSRLLASLAVGIVDAAALVERICVATARSRRVRGPARVTLALSRSPVPGPLARRLAMVAHELIINAVKHAFPDGDGELEVRVETLASSLVLSVIDDGPGLAATRTPATLGSRLSGGIVGELVRNAGGSIECDTGPGGTAIHVALPIDPWPPSETTF